MVGLIATVVLLFIGMSFQVNDNIVSYTNLSTVYYTTQRSIDWTSEEVLFTAGSKVCPLNAKVLDIEYNTIWCYNKHYRYTTISGR